MTVLYTFSFENSLHFHGKLKKSANRRTGNVSSKGMEFFFQCRKVSIRMLDVWMFALIEFEQIRMIFFYLLHLIRMVLHG